MVSCRLPLAGALLIATSTAQLLLNPLGRGNGHRGRPSPIDAYLNHEEDTQHRLNGGPSPSFHGDDLPPFRAGQFTLTPQSNATCATYGEDQWTGTIDVTDTRRLFFWYFDSRNDPENDPIIIWLNGGPGGSSMMGLFTEMGPCWLEPGADETIANDFAWNNNASLLFIDQPAGVGFSSVAEGAPVPSVDMDGAQDFQTFLNIFFGHVFPEKAHLPIHIAAESYGGHYAPVYVHHIILSRAYDSSTAFWGKIESMILIDALVDIASPSVGAYELLCSDFRGGDIVSAAACESIRLSAPECENLGRSCALSYDGYECFSVASYCVDNIDAWYWEQVELGLRNPYNIGIGCSDFPDCADERKGNFTAFLNQPRILEALHFPPSFTFHDINWDINTVYTENASPWKPTTREVAAILDAHVDPSLRSRGTDIRLLVLNGNEDFVVNTPGNIWTYDNLLWGGHVEYRIAPWERMPEDVAATGFWKGTRDGRLVFVGVDKAGHMVPGDVREGSAQILQKWLDGGWSR